MEHFVAVFDNDENDKLGLLKEEENAVADSMTVLTKAGWTVNVRGNMGGRSLADLLGMVQQDVTVFHFSGHHGHGLLKMADGKVNAEPLIDFLNGCPKLKLVFINGCDSLNFVEGLTKVPIVIGTFKPIIDDYAKDVSAGFYRSIQMSPDRFTTADEVQKIFEDARNLVDMQEGADDKATRGLVNWGEDRSPKDVYKIRINRSIPDFDNRFLGSAVIDVNKQFWERVQALEQEIGYRQIGQGEFYKVYPYVFSQLLADLKPELSVKGGIVRLKDIDELSELSKLSFDRCIAIFELHYQLITFLKFGAFSILWTLHNKKVLDLKQLSPDDKQVLRDHLKHHYYGSVMVGSDKIADLTKIYAMIPFDVIRGSDGAKEHEVAVWTKMQELVTTEQETLQAMANLIHSFTSEEAQNSKTNWLQAENFLMDFVTKEAFAFLRGLSIWSIYDIYYRQFRYKEEKELVYKRGQYPIGTRPVEGISDEGTLTLGPEDAIDYDVQSVYLVNEGERVLNLTPFYVDMYASDENANKMEICYLEAYRDKMKLNYVSIMDREEWHEIGEAKEDNEQKFIYDQVAHFWKLISD